MLIKAVTSIGVGVRYELGPNDSLTVGSGVSIISTDSYAVRIGDHRENLVDNLNITVAGLLQAGRDDYGIYVAQRGVEDNVRIVIEKTGMVIGGATGINTGTNVVCDVVIGNRGTITGRDGILLRGGETAQITNTGTILSERYGVIMNEVLGGTILFNSGRISGGVYGFEGGERRDQVINSGVMTGDVRLQGGTDLYDGRGGRVNGTVFGRDGDDRFIAGGARDVFDAQAGFDTLDFRKGGAVKMALDGAGEGTGAAKGDTYLGFEVVLGSARNDVLRGDIENNLLVGNGGNDRLNGAFGQDTIIGGAGRDTLTGGGVGDDSFQFSRPGDGADVITDFGNEVGNDDTLLMSSSGFGFGPASLIAPRFFRSGTTNQAQDSNDRFIFRTGDETLWFDRDGKGGKGPVLIADFSDGLRLTADDFVLF